MADFRDPMIALVLVTQLAITFAVATGTRERCKRVVSWELLSIPMSPIVGSLFITGVSGSWYSLTVTAIFVVYAIVALVPIVVALVRLWWLKRHDTVIEPAGAPSIDTHRSDAVAVQVLRDRALRSPASATRALVAIGLVVAGFGWIGYQTVRAASGCAPFDNCETGGRLEALTLLPTLGAFGNAAIVLIRWPWRRRAAVSLAVASIPFAMLAILSLPGVMHQVWRIRLDVSHNVIEALRVGAWAFLVVAVLMLLGAVRWDDTSGLVSGGPTWLGIIATAVAAWMAVAPDMAGRWVWELFESNAPFVYWFAHLGAAVTTIVLAKRSLAARPTEPGTPVSP